MHLLTLEEEILKLIGAADYQPLKPREIAQRLKLPKYQVREVRKVVKRLAREGRLGYTSKHLVVPLTDTGAGTESSSVADRRLKEAENKALASGGKLVLGVFERARQGYGFVRRATLEGAPLGGEDIFIPARNTHRAIDGDLVLVRLNLRSRGRQGPSGEIVEVVHREKRQFVGRYFESAGAAFVRVDGTLFARPIPVGDPGAKNVQPDDKVVIELLRFPAPWDDGEGVIVEVLGPHGKPGVDTLSVIRQFSLPERFPPEVLAEARRLATRFDASLDGRLDLTEETIVTIDPADARDFDDAVSVVRPADGNWRLGVHIADVAHFVAPGSALDREAAERGTSVYLPDRVLPMLPELLSNGLASLQPGKVRYTKSVFMDFSPEGERLSAVVHRSAIRSSKRLTYEQVDEFLSDPASGRKKLGAKVAELLERMSALARLLRRRRMARGALELAMPEVKIELDKEGRVTGARVIEDTESHQIIEEFMLAANEAVAEMLARRKFPFLQRIHEPPSPLKLQALADFVAALGYRPGDLQDRFRLQKLLTGSRGRPHQNAVHYAVLRSLQRAVYSPKEEGHFALASRCYCHFTSPIRRYPDLTVHRLVDALLDKTRPREEYSELVALGRHCSDREQRAEAAERDLTKLKLLIYLSRRIGEEMDAIVTGVESYGIFVQGVQLPAEGLVRVETLDGGPYRLDRQAHVLLGRRGGRRFRLGDIIRVAVAEVDLERREIDFRLVDTAPASKVRSPKGTRKKRPAP